MNCVLIVIDSLDYTRCQHSKEDLLPYLNKCAQNGIVCENMYSQAPYTEAAAMALYCGQNTLDHHGYIERYGRAKTTLFEMFSDNGYDVYFNALQPQCFPSSLRRGITDIVYNRGFDIIGLWNYRLQHYSQVYERGELNEQDYIQIRRLLDDNFIEWTRFLNDLVTDDPSVRMIKPLNKKYKVLDCKQRVDLEFEKYKADKKEYIQQILSQKTKHPLFQIPYFKQQDYTLDLEVKNCLNEECSEICQKIRKENIVSNLFFNPDVYRQCYYAYTGYLKNKNKADLRARKMLIKNALAIHDFRSRYGVDCSMLKGQPSFRTHVNDFLSWIDRRAVGDKSYFACIHVDDIHFPEMFFTYDAQDKSVLMQDLAMIKDYLSKRSKTVPGTISTDLSLLYADNQCRYLVEEMKKRGQYENTVFVVTADHGFSYSGYPIRDKAVNTFYLENFKIPFYVFGGGIEKKRITTLCSSVDIPVTLCQIFSLDRPKSFVGRSVAEHNKERSILTIEYCGGGCPDISRRKLMIAAFDEKCMVAVETMLNHPLSVKDIVAVYDLQKDPLQRKNIKQKFTLERYMDYYKVIEERLEQIKNTL